jgi:hypothetical protein
MTAFRRQVLPHRLHRRSNDLVLLEVEIIQKSLLFRLTLPRCLGGFVLFFLKSGKCSVELDLKFFLHDGPYFAADRSRLLRSPSTTFSGQHKGPLPKPFLLP